MSSPYELFATDKGLESESGVVVDYGDFSFTVLRAGGSNSKYRNVAQREYRKRKHAIDSGTITEDESRKMLAEVYADSVIIDWKGVKGPDGKELKFSRENVVRLLNDLPELFADLRERATAMEAFKVAELEAVSKNS